jgi:hypothetical protein
VASVRQFHSGGALTADLKTSPVGGPILVSTCALA